MNTVQVCKSFKLFFKEDRASHLRWGRCKAWWWWWCRGCCWSGWWSCPWLCWWRGPPADPCPPPQAPPPGRAGRVRGWPSRRWTGDRRTPESWSSWKWNSNYNSVRPGKLLRQSDICGKFQITTCHYQSVTWWYLKNFLKFINLHQYHIYLNIKIKRIPPPCFETFILFSSESNKWQTRLWADNINITEVCRDNALWLSPNWWSLYFWCLLTFQ